MGFIAVAVTRALLGLTLAFSGLAGDEVTLDEPWYGVDDGKAQVHLYFGWSSTCPHCAAAKPFIAWIDEEYSWLVVHSLQVDGDNRDNVQQMVDLTESIGETFQYVPTFVYCERMIAGYGSDLTTGAALEADLVECQAAAQAQLDAQIEDETVPPSTLAPVTEPPTEIETVDAIALPFVGEIDPGSLSLPAFTVVIAAFDAFNPCAFFVLLFLLSLLVHARSRQRMAAIGGTFVVVSGVVYFAFMVAWLNVFLVVGALPWVTVFAGLVAMTIAVVNIKDYFWFQRGPSLAIPDTAKPKLFGRMRELTTSTSLPLMFTGTIALAFAANSYELLCTAGFPLVFTRVLTLNELPTVEYYGYLALYNLVYVTPLLLIVGVFVWTLGSRKLTERGGRVLKLMSGLMMLGLGVVLVFASSSLTNPFTAPAVVLVSLLVTGGVLVIDRRRARRKDSKGVPSHV